MDNQKKQIIIIEKETRKTVIRHIKDALQSGEIVYKRTHGLSSMYITETYQYLYLLFTAEEIRLRMFNVLLAMSVHL